MTMIAELPMKRLEEPEAVDRPWARAAAVGAILLLTTFALWRDPGLRGARGLPALKTADFVQGIPVPKEDARLVVATLDVTKSLLAESDKRLFGVDLGRTRVSLSMPARVHYAIDLSRPDSVRLRVDRQRRSVTAVFSRPEVQAVELFPAGKRVTIDAGWARSKLWSGRALQDGLESGVYDAVREEASSPAVLDQIQGRARPVLARLLYEYLKRAGALGPEGIQYTRIRFESDEDLPSLSMVKD